MSEDLRADEERVYVSSRFGVAALDRETGTPLWEEEPSLALAGLSYVLIDGVVVVARGDEEIAGRRATDGALLWERSGPAGALTASAEAAFGTDGEALFAYDPITGTPRWESSLDPGGFVGLAAGADLVCAERLVSPPADARLTCHESSDGSVLWSRLVYSPPWVVVTESVVLVGGLELREGPGWMALDPASGQTLWKNPTLEPGEAPATSPDGSVLYGCASECVAVRVEDGEVLWRVAVGSDPVDPPAASGKAVLVSGSSGQPLYVLDAATGAIRTRVPPGPTAPFGFCGRPATSQDLVFVYACAGDLHAYRLSSLLSSNVSRAGTAINVYAAAGRPSRVEAGRGPLTRRTP